MTSPTTDLRAELEADFGRARERLVEARRRQQVKDTPRHRAAVADCRAGIDMVLDLYLTVVAAPAELPAAPAAPPRSSGPVATAALRPACGAAPGAA
ncbi:hypothetical protein SAMN06272737_101265 [Blastococcus mobilis]|uniref:Uncharacterized protein n=1 Tax=Blastococcus mobilis TaxID=1938746 RepID=A0A238UQW1_9ACTN|nr:hypothetical protein SAMN06272737_101265 [Blastococcus mobilis]